MSTYYNEYIAGLVKQLENGDLTEEEATHMDWLWLQLTATERFAVDNWVMGRI